MYMYCIRYRRICFSSLSTCVVFFILFGLRLVSCVPYVASFSGLSILDCPLRFSLTFIIFILFLWQSMVVNVREIMAAGLTVINTTINHQLCRRLNKKWSHVLFFDESLLDWKGCVRVYRGQMERFNDYYVREHDKFGGRSGMKWRRAT
jgi:hypothetical protein